MASACVNNFGISPESFSAAGKFPPYGCLSPRASFSREAGRSSLSVSGSGTETKLHKTTEEAAEIQDAGDFEFRLEDPVTMLPADELFSDGKLLPLQFSCLKQHPFNALTEKRLPENEKCRRIEMETDISATGHLFSPKAPRCSSRWKDLLGLKRFSQSSKTTSLLSSSSSCSSNSRSSASSLKQFLHRSYRSSFDGSSLSLPLLKESDCESLFISSSRLSLSSSSSGHDHDDLPRLSLDSERQTPNLNLNPNLSPNPFAPARSLNPNPPRMRLVKKPRDGTHSAAGTGRVGRSPMRRPAGESSSEVISRGVSVDSPRLNSSGKIVFQNLERSSSSPSSFNGGTNGYRHRGMERSYSANVRVTPVLNVPVCSLRGGSKSGLFGQLFSSSSSSSASSSHQQKIGNGTNRVCHPQALHRQNP